MQFTVNACAMRRLADPHQSAGGARSSPFGTIFRSARRMLKYSVPDLADHEIGAPTTPGWSRKQTRSLLDNLGTLCQSAREIGSRCRSGSCLCGAK